MQRGPSRPRTVLFRPAAQVIEANNYLLKKKAEDLQLQEQEEGRMLAYAANKERDLLEVRPRPAPVGDH